MALAVRIPLEERHVLGGDLDEAGAVLDEAAGEEAAAAEAAGVVILLHLGRLEGDVERGALLGAEQAIGVIHRAQHRRVLVVAEQVTAGRRVDEPAELAITVHETTRIHALGRTHGGGGFLGERQVHRTIFAAKESGGGEGLEFLTLADAFEALADVDEGGHHRIARAEHAGHPGADVRAGDGLRRDIAGMPMELVTRMQDAAEVGLHRRTDQRAAVHDPRDVLESFADADAVDRRRDRREGAEHAVVGESLLVRRVALRVEGLGRGHAAGEPDENDRVRGGGGLDELLALGEEARRAHRQRRGAGGGEHAQEFATGERLGQGRIKRQRGVHGDQRMVWNSGSMHTAHRRSAMPCSEISAPTMPAATLSSAGAGSRLKAER